MEMGKKSLKAESSDLKALAEPLVGLKEVARR